MTLLQLSLWGKETLPTLNVPHTEAEWQSLYQAAERQTVTGLLYEAVQLLPEEMLPPISLMMQLAVRAETIEQQNRRMNGVLRKLSSLMEELDAKAAIFKGQTLAANYRTPSLRECGDIDLYLLDPADEGRVRLALEERGMTVTRHPDGALSYRLGGIEVEHHSRLIDLHRPSLQRYVRELMDEEGFERVVIDGEETALLTPTPTLHLLLQNTHILKHAMGNGVGLRQLCDMARSYHQWHSMVDGDRLKEVYRRCGLLRWSRLLHTFLVRELGMPLEDLPYTEELLPHADTLKDIITEGGNFGQHTEHWQRTSSSPWLRKWHTLTSFLRHATFSLRYAPSETVWTILTLMKGQTFNGERYKG